MMPSRRCTSSRRTLLSGVCSAFLAALLQNATGAAVTPTSSTSISGSSAGEGYFYREDQQEHDVRTSPAHSDGAQEEHQHDQQLDHEATSSSSGASTPEQVSSPTCSSSSSLLARGLGPGGPTTGDVADNCNTSDHSMLLLQKGSPRGAEQDWMALSQLLVDEMSEYVIVEEDGEEKPATGSAQGQKHKQQEAEGLGGGSGASASSSGITGQGAPSVPEMTQNTSRGALAALPEEGEPRQGNGDAGAGQEQPLGFLGGFLRFVKKPPSTCGSGETVSSRELAPSDPDGGGSEGPENTGATACGVHRSPSTEAVLMAEEDKADTQNEIELGAEENTSIPLIPSPQMTMVVEEQNECEWGGGQLYAPGHQVESSSSFTERANIVVSANASPEGTGAAGRTLITASSTTETEGGGGPPSAATRTTSATSKSSTTFLAPTAAYLEGHPPPVKPKPLEQPFSPFSSFSAGSTASPPLSPSEMDATSKTIGGRSSTSGAAVSGPQPVYQDRNQQHPHYAEPISLAAAATTCISNLEGQKQVTDFVNAVCQHEHPLAGSMIDLEGGASTASTVAAAQLQNHQGREQHPAPASTTAAFYGPTITTRPPQSTKLVHPPGAMATTSTPDTNSLNCPTNTSLENLHQQISMFPADADPWHHSSWGALRQACDRVIQDQAQLERDIERAKQLASNAGGGSGGGVSCGARATRPPCVENSSLDHATTINIDTAPVVPVVTTANTCPWTVSADVADLESGLSHLTLDKERKMSPPATRLMMANTVQPGVVVGTPPTTGMGGAGASAVSSSGKGYGYSNTGSTNQHPLNNGPQAVTEEDFAQAWYGYAPNKEYGPTNGGRDCPPFTNNGFFQSTAGNCLKECIELLCGCAKMAATRTMPANYGVVRTDPVRKNE
ncbi:unnamed protein product [Amoebophrya sp. A120]|nr:unnamed protein product [Amoebophrya sp. A120]|eukprot:GSA120T00008234001.1